VKGNDDMKFSMPKWLRRSDAPEPEILAQPLGAHEALEAALAAEKAAQAVFDANGSPETEETLRIATAQRESAQRHVDRADRLVKALEARKAAEALAALRERETELHQMIADDTEDNALAGDEAAALASFIETRARRLALIDHKRGLERELNSVRFNLGKPMPVTNMQLIALANAETPRSEPVVDELRLRFRDFSPVSVVGQLVTRVAKIL